MENNKNLFIVNHPLILDKLTRIRNQNTQKKDFKENLSEIATLMAYEVFKDLPVDDIEIQTPITKVTGKTLSKTIILCPILRAGLGMTNGFEYVVPNAIISHIGLYRNEETLKPHNYFFKYPKNITNMDEALVFILDPMLATGGTANAAIKELKKVGFKHITLVAIVGAPVAIERIEQKNPDVKIYIAALDKNLNDNGYIVPGLGDAGDRIFGTK
ncbi:uracil phosphoribosyltransferase [Spiroplasma sp. AdecLV25b]|uniref:uracil phosphoribosyltransferase n=1 Tax=Spiroplasma sp. AdecLV25b TaxID=3027162 RepID=UPI0027E04974|nr:uracil phosphoribosyltransferase [Spiroplasma sp. AdecLV25b]